ncbi:Hypothetical predicted protein [Mytilus galloprovincialis]|uniref:Uncharacterized protein n=1 Tax=Mytilus galloprovincialis TaxID=29158 RepID=A0A8B6F9R4_MYTGA|nr:Hypothetical predicted protein [Mytilus galloprovincialis]
MEKVCSKDQRLSFIDLWDDFCRPGMGVNPIKTLFDKNDPSGVHINPEGAKQLVSLVKNFMSIDRLGEYETPSGKKRTRSSASTPGSAEKQQSKRQNSSLEETVSKSDSDIPTHPESCQKDASQTTQAAEAEQKTPSFTFNKQASNNLENHSNLSEKKEQRHVKKAKRAKNKKDKQNSNKDQPSMERFLAEAFRTPSNKTNEEKKTRTKQTASTPTDELHKREEPVKKTKS